MKAYSVVDREGGYCQGSAFIVGLLLMQMPEEAAFCVFVKLMRDNRLRELFKPSMAELGLCMYQCECMIEVNVHSTFCTPSWKHHFNKPYVENIELSVGEILRG